MPENDIVININSSNHNQLVSSIAELIQCEAFDTLRRQIFNDLAQARSKAPKENVEKEELYSPESGLTYFIDGTRGAGKSTFLDFTYRNLNKIEGKKGEVVSIMPLVYLDPSRIESSEVVLLHILKHLKRLMENCPHRGQDWGKHQEQFRDLFKQMAGGLHLFVSSADSLKDLDAELFLDCGLDRAADSQRLRHLLLQTIEQVCLAYKTQALLLAIDDADTKFANAIEVLECIRKYLDTPQMVVLVTGDMEMYSLLVQNHFQKDFARHNKGFSSDREVQLSRMVAHLEEQYLLKLFPIQRRVQLKTLHTLTKRKRKDSKLSTHNGIPAFVVKKLGNGDKDTSLQAAIEDIAIRGLRLRDRLDLDFFREHVLKLPVRSVLQLLSAYNLLLSDYVSVPEAAADALRATALSSLYRYDIDVESIAEGDLHAVINAAFDLCKLDGESDTAIYLRPQSRDAALRNAYVSLAADVAWLCEHNPAKAIIYMVSMAGSINILHMVTAKATPKPGARGTDDSPDESILQRKVKQYLSVGRKDNALNWAFHATAALISTSTTTGMQLRQGIIGVRITSKNNACAFDSQIATALNNFPASPYPAIAFSQSAVKKPDNTRRYLSIFNTLGLISNLLDLDVTDADGLRKLLFKQLNKILSVQTVSLPNWDDPARDKEADDEAEESEYDGDDHSPLGNLVDQLASWLGICQELKKHFNPSAMLMGKIWNRLYFSLDNISANMRTGNDSRTDGLSCKAMELFAWALINACLVEEVDYHYREDNPELAGATLNRYNPRSSGGVVMKKFQTPTASAPQPSLDITVRMAPLAFMVSSCPLVLGLIKRDAHTKSFICSLNAKLKDFRGSQEIPEEALCSPDVWNMLGKTTISE
ncbi:P-loop NTPase fold protein [Microvirgula aerodenitrificans]|uniref:P-loop NTPase fold protein n=1 Tax=Microvirgula aerodenitrificans TaxID=57480 RepID=UPI002F41BC2F